MSPSRRELWQQQYLASNRHSAAEAVLLGGDVAAIDAVITARFIADDGREDHRRAHSERLWSQLGDIQTSQIALTVPRRTPRRGNVVSAKQDEVIADVVIDSHTHRIQCVRV